MRTEGAVRCPGGKHSGWKKKPEGASEGPSPCSHCLPALIYTSQSFGFFVGSSTVVLFYSFNWCPPEVFDLKLKCANNGSFTQCSGYKRTTLRIATPAACRLPSLSPTGNLIEIDHMKNSREDVDKNEEDKRVFPQWHNLLWMDHYDSVTSERRSKGLWEKSSIKEE